MSRGTRYTDEFKREAVNQVTVHGYSVNDVAQRLGICTKTLYDWRKKLAAPSKTKYEENDLRAENARLKKQLKRAEQERNILKEAAVFFASESKKDTDL